MNGASNLLNCVRSSIISIITSVLFSSSRFSLQDKMQREVKTVAALSCILHFYCILYLVAYLSFHEKAINALYELA